jgi:hypothetical protein
MHASVVLRPTTARVRQTRRRSPIPKPSQTESGSYPGWACYADCGPSPTGNDSRYRGTVSLKNVCSGFGPLVCQSSEDGRQACMQDFSIGILCSLSCSGSFSLCPSAMSPLLCSLSGQSMHAQSLLDLGVRLGRTIPLNLNQFSHNR